VAVTPFDPQLLIRSTVFEGDNEASADNVSGTILSGLISLLCCCGVTRHPPEFKGNDCDKRFCNFVVNLLVGMAQFFTIILCLVGWCWSIGWGLTLINVASKLKERQVGGENFKLLRIFHEDSSRSVKNSDNFVTFVQ